MADQWVDLRLLVLNRGDHAKAPDIYGAIKKHRIHVATLCEMHSVQPILGKMVDNGLRVWRGNREDSEATPVVWDPDYFRVTKADCKSYPLLPAGKRGGKYNMAKTLNIAKGTFIPARRSIAVGSIHNIQTQTHPARKGAARNYVENALDHVEHRRTALILSGDYNAKPTGASLEPMRNARGWHCDQQVLKPLDTGPHHSPIDMAWHRDRKAEPGIMRLHSHRTIDVDGTDHKGLIVVYKVRIRAA